MFSTFLNDVKNTRIRLKICFTKVGWSVCVVTIA